MQFNCPHCQIPIEIADLPSTGEVACPGCGAKIDPQATHSAHDISPGKSTAAFVSAELEGTVIGPYKLLQLLGKGGMGAVWMAEQTAPVQRRVAIKIIKPGVDGDQILPRFEAERQALAMMDHPNIAKVLDAGATDDGKPYFVMELVKGISFTKYCDQEHLTPAERLALFIPVCNAVQHAHQKGIIHRDLKPSNVLIGLYDGKPVPKVIDFGVAKATQQKLTERTLFTEIGQIVGTLEYMAPEQAELNNLDIDTRADIYSLGVMLYELLTGSPPFTSKQLRGAALTEVLRLIKEVEPAKPSTKLSASKELPAIAAKRKLEPTKLSRLVQGDLDWIVMKCLEKDRSRRYETASQLGDELKRYLADEPVQAGPPSVGYRAKKFLRRNKGPVIAAGLVFFVLIAGIVGTSIGLVESEKATEKALKAAENERQAGAAEKIATKKALDAAEAEKLATKKALEAAEANKVLAEKEAKARKGAEDLAKLNKSLADKEAAARREAEERRKQAERLALQVRFDHFYSRAKDDPALALVGIATLLPDAEKIGDMAIVESMRLHIGHLSQQVHRLRWVALHERDIYAVAFSPDGKSIVVGSADSTGRLYETATGKPIGAPLEHKQMISAVAFSPDGRTVATASSDRTARLWNASTGKPVGQPLQHKGPVRVVSFNSNSKSVVTASEDGAAQIWDTATGNPIGDRLQHKGEVWAATFSPDGNWVLTGSTDSTARLWDATSGKPIGGPMTHFSGIRVVAFSPDGKVIATGSADRTVRLWNAPAGTSRGLPMPHLGIVTSIAFSPNSDRVLTGSVDGMARQWSAANGNAVAVPLVHPGYVWSVAYSPDGKTILTGCFDWSARSWDAATGKAIGQIMYHQGPVLAAAFSPDGKSLVTAGRDSTIRFWDVPAGARRLRTDVPDLYTAHLSHDGGNLITGSADQAIRTWDTTDGRLREKPFIPGGFALGVSPDGNIVLTGHLDNARLSNVSLRKIIGQPIKHEKILAVAPFSPNGRLVLTQNNKFAQLWDAATGDAVGTPLKFDTTSSVFTFSPDGKNVAGTSDSKSAQIWEIPSGKPMGLPLRHGDHVTAIAFSPDNQALATGSSDKTVRMWHVPTGKPLGPILRHSSGVSAVNFSADNQLVVTGCHNRTATLWEAKTGKVLLPPLPHQESVTKVYFSADRRVIVTGSNMTKLWETATGKLLELPPQPPTDTQEIRLAVSGNGRILATGNLQQGIIWVCKIPSPISGDASRIRHWAEVITELEADLTGGTRYLDLPAWQQRREQLQKLGGPPVFD